MGKLGKKARKFARKHLQPLLKRRRKMKSILKRKFSSRNEQDAAKVQAGDMLELSNGRNPAVEDIKDMSLDAIFSEDDTDEDASDSDGFFSEDSSCPYIDGSDSQTCLEDGSCSSDLALQNKKIHLELAKRKKKLDKLKEKDPKFSEFLERRSRELESRRNEGMDSDEDETSSHGMEKFNEDESNLRVGKSLTSCCIKSWSQLVMEQHSVSALTNLINGYRAACHYGNKSTSGVDAVPCRRIRNSEAFSDILMFMLNEADNVFRGLLGVSCSNCRKDAVMELKSTSKWETLKPFIKSYLRSTLVLLNQVTDNEFLGFTLTRLRASIIFFAAFPSLLRRLIKVSVDFWAIGGGNLSSCSFFIIRDVVMFRSDCFETCFAKIYKTFIARYSIVDPSNIKQIQFLRDSCVELFSLDVYKSVSKALVSVQQLARILQQGLRAKKKEALKSICSWQYINCIDLWVTFIAMNTRDYDLHLLLFMVIQVINGVTYLFPGPKYVPLRFKCIQWLNNLSNSSGIFIPVASLVLDMLEFSTSKEGGRPGKASNFSLNLKLPKHWLKSQNFEELCVFSVIELLSAHFAQWSYHISFPDLATIPLIRLKRFYETTSIESLKRVVKRFIDQVEQNVEFVQRKRVEVTFSPIDQQSVESFLQLEKCSGNASFTQYYKSVIEKAASRNLAMKEKMSFMESKKLDKRRQQQGLNDAVGNGTVNSKRKKVNMAVKGEKDGKRGKKQRT
ncbi:protein REBELOTE isoform X2 [Malania oleifera]|uniref:protein REBELOTE isoform X2 n=1 Tax=Malania oleifera TaxID=397392 RepID=UPI0025AE2CE4|nr:protein REBELOTE isoform X2 [Malania oleifera]XP_057981368.1 protein REBELOTE isoform X2 [Malania oleifera]